MSAPTVDPGIEQQTETSPNGRYIRYNSILGRGSYKTVYKAFDTEEALEVAWNKLHVERLSPHDMEKVTNEVSLLRRVEHKNIIHFYDTWPGTDGNGNQTINFITEQMMSGTLKEYLKKAKAIKLKVIRRWCANILEAIAYLHSRDPPIMHRDLKCDNIFINGHVGEVKIGDLGLSGVKEREKADSVIGTPEFMAPELYEESYTEKVDIYAFGMCLLEIVSMEYPYSECNNMAQIFKKVFNGEKPRAFNMLIDGAVKDVIAACLEREERRPSAAALLQHPLFSEWDKDDGHVSNLSLVKGHQTDTETKLEAAHSNSSNMPIGTELIDWSDPLKRNVLVSMIEGEGGGNEEQQVSVIASRENGGFYIGLEIPIRDAIKRVEFTFDPFQDNSKHIAQEMVSEFGLGAEQEDVIRAEIDHRVQIAKSHREAASRNATPQPPPRPPSSDGSAQTETASLVAPTSLPAPSASPVVHAPTVASESMKQMPEVMLSQESPPLSVVQQSELPNGSTPGLNHTPIIAEVPARSHQEPSLESLIGAHRQSETNPSNLNVPKVPVPLVEPVATRDVLPTSTPFISPQPQSMATADTPPTIMSTGTGQETHQVKPANVQSSLPTRLESEVDTALHGAQALQITDMGHKRTSVQAPSQKHQIEVPIDKEATAEEQVSYDTNNSGKNIGVNRITTPSAKPQESVESSARDVVDGPHHSSVKTPTIQQHIQAPQGMPSSHVVSVPSDSGTNSASTPQDALHPGGSRTVHEQISQPTIAEGQSVSTPTFPAGIEKMFIRDPSNVTTLPARIEGTLGQDSSNMKFPQSASDTQLPAPSSVALDIPERPPSTPMPSGASEPDLPPEQLLAAQQAGTATTAPSYEKINTDPLQKDAGATGLHDTSELNSSMQSRRLSPSQEQAKYLSQALTRELPVNGELSNPAIISRSGSGSIPQIVIVESSKGSSTEKSRRNQNEFSGSSHSSYGRRQLPTSAVYYGSQSGTERGSTEQNDPSHEIHQHIGPGIDVARNEVSRPQQRSPSEKSLMEDSWKSMQSDVSGGNTMTRAPPRKVIGVECDPEYYTMCLKLMDSCARGNFDDVLRRIEAGANPQFADYDMRTPLHIAAAEGHEHICVLLLERGALVSAKDRWANTPLADAIDNGHITVQQLLKAHGAIYEKRNSDEMLHYELMRGSADGDLEAVRAKIVAGADVTRCDYDRRTPLHLACSEGHMEVAELLLVNGASSEVRDRKGRSPVDDAVNNGHRNILRILRQYGAVIPRHLFEAQPELEYQRGIDLVEHAARGRLVAIKQALAQGVDPNFKDYDNRTALHLACIEGRLDVVRVLLHAGANVSAEDRWGSMPADEAKKGGFRNILDELTLWESQRKQRQAPVTPYDQSARAMNGHSRSSLPISDDRSPHFDELSHGIASSVSMGAISSINLSADDFAAKYPTPSRGSGVGDRASSTSLPIHIERDDDSVAMSFDDEQRMLEQEFKVRMQELAEKRRRAMEGYSRRRSMDSTRSSRGSGEPAIAIIGQPRQVPRDAGSSSDMEKRVDESTGNPSSTSYSSMTAGNEGVAVSSPRHSSSGLQVPLVVSDGISSRVSTVQVLGRGGGVVVEEVIPRRVNPDIRLLVDNLVDVASRRR